MDILKKFEDDARIEKQDGSVVGPYKASFPGKTIFILDEKADVAFYKSGVAGMGAHFQIKYSKGGQSEMQKPGHTINIHGAQSVQVGDHNTQNIVNSFEALVKKIESADVPPVQKEEAKGMLRKLLEHPAVVSVIGAAAKAVF